MDLRIEYVPLEEIKPYAGNAKLHPAEQIEQIKNSIREFGFDDPIAVWNGEIVEGHGRFIAANELGIDTVPIIRLDHLTDEQRRAYNIAHNKLTMNSGFNLDLLKLELDAMELDMSDFGFTEAEILELMVDDYDETQRISDGKQGFSDLGFGNGDSSATGSGGETFHGDDGIVSEKEQLDLYEQRADENILLNKRVILIYRTEEEQRYIRRVLKLGDDENINVVYDIKRIMEKENAEPEE